MAAASIGTTDRKVFLLFRMWNQWDLFPSCYWENARDQTAGFQGVSKAYIRVTGNHGFGHFRPKIFLVSLTYRNWMLGFGLSDPFCRPVRSFQGFNSIVSIFAFAWLLAFCSSKNTKFPEFQCQKPTASPNSQVFRGFTCRCEFAMDFPYLLSPWKLPMPWLSWLPWRPRRSQLRPRWRRASTTWRRRGRCQRPWPRAPRRWVVRGGRCGGGSSICLDPRCVFWDDFGWWEDDFRYTNHSISGILKYMDDFSILYMGWFLGWCLMTLS